MTDFPERFEPGSRLWVGPTEADLGRVEIVESGRHKGSYLLLLADLTSTEADDNPLVEPWARVGQLLFVRTDELVGAGEESYYYHELIGCRVLTAEGEAVGVVETIIRLGSQELLVVRGGSRGEIFVPLVEAIVREVDTEGGRVVIDPPEGLLDINVSTC
jgi:16S rRNA processing protein RimM